MIVHMKLWKVPTSKGYDYVLTTMDTGIPGGMVVGHPTMVGIPEETALKHICNNQECKFLYCGSYGHWVIEAEPNTRKHWPGDRLINWFVKKRWG